jgi:hypothetical protein
LGAKISLINSQAPPSHSESEKAIKTNKTKELQEFNGFLLKDKAFKNKRITNYLLIKMRRNLLHKQQ